MKKGPFHSTRMYKLYHMKGNSKYTTILNVKIDKDGPWLQNKVQSSDCCREGRWQSRTQPPIDFYHSKYIQKWYNKEDNSKNSIVSNIKHKNKICWDHDNCLRVKVLVAVEGAECQSWTYLHSILCLSTSLCNQYHMNTTWHMTLKNVHYENLFCKRLVKDQVNSKYIWNVFTHSSQQSTNSSLVSVKMTTQIRLTSGFI